MEFAKEYQIEIVIDLNWRDIFWENSDFTKNFTEKENINKIKKFLNYANILKLSKEESLLFFGNDDPTEISNCLLKKPDVIITDGPNPILWLIDGIQGSTSINHEMEIVDTTGAGDSFLAGFISQLVHSSSTMNKIEINNCVRFANVSGLLTCHAKGAIEAQPTYSDVLNFLGHEEE